MAADDLSLAPVEQRPDAPGYGAFAPSRGLARIIRATRACGPGWAGMRRAFTLRALGQRIAGGAPVDHMVYGARMRLRPGDNLCEKRLLYTPQYFDPAERALIARRLRPDTVFVDIGANVGAYALYVAALAGPRARIVAVEPQPDMYERLIFNIRQNEFATVKAIECAVADEDRVVTLFVDLENRARASIRMLFAEGGAHAQIAAPAVTLAALAEAEKLTRIDMMKVDVAGAEDIVLEPFFERAPAALWPQLLIVDAAGLSLAPALARRLEACGYARALATRSNIVFERA
ncbi:MAG: FkbM family methyltransferase [Rhizobiales bacterium]|nr:FkbM family methyltransferase [Hyphomicrobiales bacterium]